MIATANNTFAGHVGCNPKWATGKAADVMATYAKYIPLAACFDCMLNAHEQGGSMADAAAACDAYCGECTQAEQTSGFGATCSKHSGLGHWVQRPCSCCLEKNKVCYSIYVISHHADCGSPADTVIKQRTAYLQSVSLGVCDADPEGVSGAQADDEPPRARTSSDLEAERLSQHEQQTDEEPLMGRASASTTPGDAGAMAPAALRGECSRRGFQFSGDRDVLVARLRNPTSADHAHSSVRRLISRLFPVRFGR